MKDKTVLRCKASIPHSLRRSCDWGLDLDLQLISKVIRRAETAEEMLEERDRKIARLQDKLRQLRSRDEERALYVSSDSRLCSCAPRIVYELEPQNVV